MIIPITPTEPACYGICCNRHAECARYSAAEDAGRIAFIGTCLDGAELPLFVAKEKAQ